MSDPARQKRLRPTDLPAGPERPPVLGEARRAQLRRLDGRVPAAAVAPVLFRSGRRGDRLQVLIAGLLAFLLLGSMVVLAVIGTGAGRAPQADEAPQSVPLAEDIDGETVVVLPASGQAEQGAEEEIDGGPAGAGGSLASGTASGFIATTGGVASGFATGSGGGPNGARGGQGQGQAGGGNPGDGQGGGAAGGDAGLVGGGDAQVDGGQPEAESPGSEKTKPVKVKPPKTKPGKEPRGNNDAGVGTAAVDVAGTGHSNGHGRGHETAPGKGHDKHH